MGLSAEGFIRGGGGGLISGSKQKVSETTDDIRQNENLYLKRNEVNVLYYFSVYLLKKLFLKSYSYGSAYARGDLYVNSLKTSVKQKRDYLRGLIGGEIRYLCCVPVLCQIF